MSLKNVVVIWSKLTKLAGFQNLPLVLALASSANLVAGFVEKSKAAL